MKREGGAREGRRRRGRGGAAWTVSRASSSMSPTGASDVKQVMVGTRMIDRMDLNIVNVNVGEITIMRNDTEIDIRTSMITMSGESIDIAEAIMIDIDDDMKRYEMRYVRTPKDSLRDNVQTYLSFAAVCIEVPLELA